MTEGTAIVSDLSEITDRTLSTFRKYGVTQASVFGSFVHGEQTPRSDVDFLVEFEPGRSLLDLSGLRLELGDLLGRKVDVVTHNALHPRLKDRILREQVQIL
jgi:predicted nucleotidyltransferase